MADFDREIKGNGAALRSMMSQMKEIHKQTVAQVAQAATTAAEQANAAALEASTQRATQLEQWQQFQSKVAADRAMDARALDDRLVPLITTIVDSRTEAASRDHASGQAAILAALEGIRSRADDSTRHMTDLTETVRRLQNAPVPTPAAQAAPASILANPAPANDPDPSQVFHNASNRVVGRGVDDIPSSLRPVGGPGVGGVGQPAGNPFDRPQFTDADRARHRLNDLHRVNIQDAALRLDEADNTARDSRASQLRDTGIGVSVYTGRGDGLPHPGPRMGKEADSIIGKGCSEYHGEGKTDFSFN